MDRQGQNSVYGTSKQQTSFQDRDTTLSKHTVPSLQNRPLPPINTNNLKSIPFATPQFTVPPLPSSTRRRTASPDTRTSPNPARQIFSYPVSHPHEVPSERKMTQDDGPPPSQRRKLNSPENRSRSGTSEGDPDSRRGSGNKGAMSYDPVHEYHQHANQHHHSRRPSSAHSFHSQHSRVSSYSAQSSNADEEESTSPPAGDQPTTRDGKKRKHKCEECGQYFTRLHNLKSHLLTHSQEKPFVCSECNHKFRRLHDLKRHNKLHTGERPYTCPGCNRSFARMDALNRHRKPGGECSLHNLQPTTPTQQDAVERRMSLPPGFGRPGSSQGASPMPQSPYASETNINPALAMSSHGHSYPPTHLPPKNKHRYEHHGLGDGSPGLLVPPPSNTAFGRGPPSPAFGPGRPGRGVQPPPLVIPNTATGPVLSPIHGHYSAGTGTGSNSSGGRSVLDTRSPMPPVTRDDNLLPSVPLTESPRGYTPPPQPPPPLTVPPPSLPLLPSPSTLISPSARNSFDRSARQSLDVSRPSEGSRGYIEMLVERNERLEERVNQLESYVHVLWQDRGGDHSRRQITEDHHRPSSRPQS